MATFTSLSEVEALKITSDHKLVVDPCGVIELGVHNKSAFMSNSAVLYHRSKTLEHTQHRLYTCSDVIGCKSVLWAEAHTSARSGIVVAYADMSVIGGCGSRLLVAVPPYKKKLNLKGDMEALTFLELTDVKALGGPIPALGKKDLPAFLKSVSTP